MSVIAKLGNIPAQTRSLSQQRSVQATVGGLLLVIMALMITNPGQPAYVNYASARLPDTLKQQCDDLDQNVRVSLLLSLPTRDLCKTFVNGVDLVGRGPIKQMIDSSTTRQNYLILSLYTTEILGRTYKTIGVGRNFIHWYSQ